MSTRSVTVDRRSRRSQQTLEALTYQLEHILERENLHNFTLGDRRGLVIANAGDRRESDVLAAYAPVLARSLDDRHRRRVLARINTLLPTLPVESIRVRRFCVDDEDLFLTLVGRPGVYRDVGLYRAITGVRRILDN